MELKKVIYSRFFLLFSSFLLLIIGYKINPFYNDIFDYFGLGVLINLSISNRYFILTIFKDIKLVLLFVMINLFGLIYYYSLGKYFSLLYIFVTVVISFINYKQIIRSNEEINNEILMKSALIYGYKKINLSQTIFLTLSYLVYFLIIFYK